MRYPPPERCQRPSRAPHRWPGETPHPPGDQGFLWNLGLLETVQPAGGDRVELSSTAARSIRNTGTGATAMNPSNSLHPLVRHAFRTGYGQR